MWPLEIEGFTIPTKHAACCMAKAAFFLSHTRTRKGKFLGTPYYVDANTTNSGEILPAQPQVPALPRSPAQHRRGPIRACANRCFGRV